MIKRIIRKINQTEEANVQSLHRAKSFSAFHTARTPLNTIAWFRNASIVSRLNHAGIPTGYGDPDISRRFFQNFYVTRIGEPNEFDSRVDEYLTDDGDSDIDAALWLRILDEEAANLMDSDE
jgi:hypothetical protein